jgi:hypothetical protein
MKTGGPANSKSLKARATRPSAHDNAPEQNS